MQINDELLLKKIIETCDSISVEEVLEERGIEDKSPLLQHPLDGGVKKMLQNIKEKCSLTSEGREVIELSYAMNSDINIFMEGTDREINHLFTLF